MPPETMGLMVICKIGGHIVYFHTCGIWM